MALLPILVAPDPRLKLKAKPVDVVDSSLRRLMDDMLETMYTAPGIGLAAPQVGVSKRLLVIDLANEGEPRSPLCMVNPELTWLSDEEATYEEGCLSVPEHYADVVRPARIRVRYVDRDNEICETAAEGLLATVIQHEMDHLDGILFLDHLTNLKRNMILRKLVKARKTPVGASL
jgi:peptide deformylase